MELGYFIAVIGGIGVPATTAAIYVIRSYIAKAKYHAKMEARLDNLDTNDKGSTDIHNVHDDRLKELEDKVQKLCDNVEDTKGWVRLILKHLKISFPDKSK